MRRLLLLWVLLGALPVRAAFVPNPFTTNSLTPATSQFDLTGNIFAITNHASITNASMAGSLTLPYATASTILTLNGSKNAVSLANGTGALTNDGSGNFGWAVGNSGTVTSVALTSPGVVYTVSGSPITSSGTLALALVNQTSNTVFAGPTSGATAAPSFRAMVAADLPAVGTAGTYRSVTFDAQGRETSGSNPTTFAGYGLSDTAANLGTVLGVQTSNTVFAGPVSGSAATPTMRALVAADIPSLTGTYLPLAGGTMTGSITNALLPGASLSGTTTNTSTFSGTFTNTGAMGISGASTLGGILTVPNGSGGAPSITFPISATTGIFADANGMGFANGGAARAYFSSASLELRNTMFIYWSSGNADGTTHDLDLGREAAAVLQQGSDATAQNTPVNQTFKGPDALAGTATNINGGNLTIAGGRSTGTGTGGSVIFQTAPAGSTGTASNALVTQLTIPSTGIANFTQTPTVNGAAVLTNASGTSIYVNGTSVSNPNLKDSGSITYTTTATTNIAPTLAAQSFNTLAYAGGTNVTLDCSLGNNSEAFYVLTVTNTTFFATPTSVPSTAKTISVQFKMDGTGGYAVTFTNTYYKFPGGVVFVPTTNANAVSTLTFQTSGSTAGQLYAGYGTLDVK